MRYERVFLQLTYGVATLGFLALVLGGATGWIGYLLIFLGLVGSHGRLRRFSPTERGWRLLTVLFVAYCAVQYVFLAVSSLSVARELVIFLQVNRLYVRKSNRDFAQIYLLSFLHILLGCVLTVNPLFAGVLVAFLVASAWALMLLQLKLGMDLSHEQRVASGAIPSVSSRGSRIPGSSPVGAIQPPGRGASSGTADGSSAGNSDGTPAGPDERYRAAAPLLSVPFLAASAIATLLMLVLTIGLFLFTPRMEISLFQHQAGNTVHVSGFSEQVKLGEVGEILTSSGRVMRVKLEASPELLASVPYWPGIALDAFDGESWSLSRAQREYYRTRPMSLDRYNRPRGTNVVQHYSLEPLDSKVVFAMTEVLGIESSVSRLTRTATGSLQSVDRQGRMDYVVYSKVLPTDPEALRQLETVMPPRAARYYLQLPELSPEVRGLAEQITAGLTSDYDRVAALEKHLRTHYTYTLEPESSGQAPLEDFLFRTKAGHCEYFASAMVVLTRSIGIPARMVNGFMGGAINPVGQYYVVRQSDAHSWAEVWFNRHGWVRFDATPVSATSASSGQAPGLSERIAQYADYFEMQWYYYVLDYDLRAQVELLSEMLSETRALTTGGMRGLEAQAPVQGRALRLQAFALAAVLGLLAVSLYLYQSRQRAAAESAAFNTVAGRRFIRERAALHRELVRRGFDRRTGETPLERALRTATALGLGDELARIESTYYGARYGAESIAPLEAEQVAAVRKAIKRLPSTRARAAAPSSPPAPPPSSPPH